ncbi:MAG: hypothetical protein WBI21_02725 [Natronincolaceae bacterium]
MFALYHLKSSDKIQIENKYSSVRQVTICIYCGANQYIIDKIQLVSTVNLKYELSGIQKTKGDDGNIDIEIG